MAMPVHPRLIGVDVSQAELTCCDHPDQPTQSLANHRTAIRHWLKSLSGPVALAVEPTNTFHVTLVEEAHRRGHTVYLIDGYRLNRYRESIGGRAKTDASDARLLRRYLARERDDLRPWTPPPPGYTRLQLLLHRRAVLVQARTALQQSLRDIPHLQRAARTLFRQLTRLDTLIQCQLAETLQQHGWQHHRDRCQALEGIGPLTATALTMAFQRGHFSRSDAFIAFLGLDVRVRDSGTFRGRRKLTKQGDPELRRLLYLAAMTACRHPTWEPFYQRHLSRGLSKTQALVVLARKLARVAFALLKNQATYQPKFTTQDTCLTT